MGKARRRTDTMDVIKHSQKLTKKAAGMKRQLASGTAFTHRSAMAATKTLGSSAGGGPTSGTGDLEMHTYDIRDVDRLYFAVTAGSSDRLETQATGIEAASYAIDVGGTLTQFTFGMNFQIPNDAVTKPSYQFNIGSGASPVEIKLNVYDGADLTIRSNVDKKSSLRFEGDGTPTGVGSHFDGSIYYDGTDIKAQVAAGVVNLTSGGGGSGASTALDNLTDPTAINQDLIMGGNNMTGINTLKFNASVTDDAYIDGAAYGLSYNVTSPDYHNFSVSTSTKLSIKSDKILIGPTGMPISANTGFIGFHVTDETTVGSLGTVELPYLRNSTFTTIDLPTYPELDARFGDFDGACGFWSADSDTAGTVRELFLWRSNGGWKQVTGATF